MGRDAQATALRRSVLGARGAADRATRQRWYDYTQQLTAGEQSGAADLDPALASYLELMARCAADIDDAAVNAMRSAGLSDDALFEATVVAAVASGLARRDLALAALSEAEQGDGGEQGVGGEQTEGDER